MYMKYANIHYNMPLLYTLKSKFSSSVLLFMHLDCFGLHCLVYELPIAGFVCLLSIEYDQIL